jgi:cytosine/adenosine deaminase-related metal-dependent hydrolase
MKFGDGALDSADGKKSGILEHFEDMVRFSDHFEFLQEEMAGQIIQKASLGLLNKSDMARPDKREKVAFTRAVPGSVDWILVLAGHDPARAELRQELAKLQSRIRDMGEAPFRVKVAVAAFMGYGLYDQGILALDEFLDRYDLLIGPRA